MTPAELKTLRESLGLTAEALGRLAGVKDRTVRYWESGRMPVPADVVQMITDLDAQFTHAASEAASIIRERVDGNQTDSVLIRYRTDADLHRYRPDMAGLPASSHAALIDRVRLALSPLGIETRIVFLDTEDYEQWREAQGLPEREDTRSLWAGQKLKGAI